MNDVLLECFCAATETLNFTTAAQKIHISQPSFSRNIAALEDEVGFSLFRRSKQDGLRLTPAGLVLYNAVVKMNEEFKLQLEKAKQISRGEEGKLVIGVLNGICLNSKCFDLITRFQQKYPNVEVELKSCTLKEMESSLLNGICDICFLMANIIEHTDQILHETIYNVESFFVVPKRLNMDVNVEHELIEFKDEYFILSEDFPKTNEIVIKQCRELGFEPKILMAPDYETRLLWTEIGKGVAGNTRDHYTKNSENVDFIKIKDALEMEFSVAWNKDNYNPSIALFYEMKDEN